MNDRTLITMSTHVWCILFGAAGGTLAGFAVSGSPNWPIPLTVAVIAGARIAWRYRRVELRPRTEDEQLAALSRRIDIEAASRWIEGQ